MREVLTSTTYPIFTLRPCNSRSTLTDKTLPTTFIMITLPGRQGLCRIFFLAIFLGLEAPTLDASLRAYMSQEQAPLLFRLNFEGDAPNKRYSNKRHSLPIPPAPPQFNSEARDEKKRGSAIPISKRHVELGAAQRRPQKEFIKSHNGEIN